MHECNREDELGNNYEDEQINLFKNNSFRIIDHEKTFDRITATFLNMPEPCNNTNVTPQKVCIAKVCSQTTHQNYFDKRCKHDSTTKQKAKIETSQLKNTWFHSMATASGGYDSGQV